MSLRLLGKFAFEYGAVLVAGCRRVGEDRLQAHVIRDYP